MANLEITSAEFDAEVLQSSVPVLVDFTATWCGPCKMIAPFVEQLATEYAGKAKVFKVDVDKEPDLAQRYNVMSIPALHVFKDGKEVTKHSGALPKDKIAGLIDSAI
ncbi:MAG: thioredoxin [Fimbriimonadaceae bacterium]|nr:thioredoxin [Fimbriimonadaceae bacterium]